MAVLFVSPYLRLSRSWIWLYSMQLIVSAHANSVIESLLLKRDCPKVYMIVVS